MTTEEKLALLTADERRRWDELLTDWAPGELMDRLRFCDLINKTFFSLIDARTPGTRISQPSRDAE